MYPTTATLIPLNSHSETTDGRKPPLRSPPDYAMERKATERGDRRPATCLGNAQIAGADAPPYRA